MQLSSMTGFARKQTNFSFGSKKYAWTWEFKSVNAKNMDIKVRLPQWLDHLDENVKGVCSKVFSRGTINVTLEIEVENSKTNIAVDTELLDVLIEKTKEVFQREPEFFSRPSAADMLKLNGVVKVVESMPDDEEMKALKFELCQSMFSAAQALKQDRLKEGRKIGKTLQEILGRISKTIQDVQKICSVMPEKLKERIGRQIKELAQGSEIPEERLAQEALLLIMRADVKEELDRLMAHVQTAQELLESNEPVGRRLDFLCQELNREANTLCSKSSDIEQTRCGMELKALIEQFREQIQNME